MRFLVSDGDLLADNYNVIPSIDYSTLLPAMRKGVGDLVVTAIE